MISTSENVAQTPESRVNNAVNDVADRWAALPRESGLVLHSQPARRLNLGGFGRMEDSTRPDAGLAHGVAPQVAMEIKR
jgi:hypothetical protein